MDYHHDRWNNRLIVWTQIQLLNMRKKIITRSGFWLSCLTLLFMSCSQEQLTDDQGGAFGTPVEVRLQINTPQGSYSSDNENAINRLRLVVFSSLGSPDAGKLILNKYYATAPVGNSLREIIISGKRDIYIIVNEPLSGGGAELDSYKNIATAADIRNLSLVYQGAGSVGVYTPTEIPMFIKHTNQLIKPDMPNDIDGRVERTMAKVTMKLNVKNSNFPTGKHVVIDNMQIKNLPEKSYLIAQIYTDALVASEKQNVSVVATESGYDFSSNNTFYVPEYIFNNPDMGAYIEITGHLNDEPNKERSWTVNLGDAMDDAGRYGNQYHITRNRHYAFTGNVKGNGHTNDLSVKVNVLPWNTVTMDDATGRYVTFDKVTDDGGITIADGSDLDIQATAFKVVCNTSIGGWYVVTRDMNHAVVHKSMSTESVSAATSQTVRVTIPPFAGPIQIYTVNIYHPTIAPESEAPVKSISFAQTDDNSVILNSVLLNAGWDPNKLPLNGLQVAKRGNLLPSEIALTDDPKMQWSTVKEKTGITSKALGTGKNNYALLQALGRDYPVSQACKNLGAGWYLSSISELAIFASNKNRLGDSYSFINDFYWSSMEDNAEYSWSLKFSSNLSAAYIKANTCRVRCIREI